MYITTEIICSNTKSVNDVQLTLVNDCLVLKANGEYFNLSIELLQKKINKHSIKIDNERKETSRRTKKGEHKESI